MSFAQNNLVITYPEPAHLSTSTLAVPSLLSQSTESLPQTTIHTVSKYSMGLLHRSGVFPPYVREDTAYLYRNGDYLPHKFKHIRERYEITDDGTKVFYEAVFKTYPSAPGFVEAYYIVPEGSEVKWHWYPRIKYFLWLRTMFLQRWL